jgi:dynein heavy chain
MNIEERNGQKKEIDEIIKNHFRPVVCIIPDFEQICFTILYSEGFLEAKVLIIQSKPSRLLNCLYFYIQ